MDFNALHHQYIRKINSMILQELSLELENIKVNISKWLVFIVNEQYYTSNPINLQDHKGFSQYFLRCKSCWLLSLEMILNCDIYLRNSRRMKWYLFPNQESYITTLKTLDKVSLYSSSKTLLNLKGKFCFDSGNRLFLVHDFIQKLVGYWSRTRVCLIPFLEMIS